MNKALNHFLILFCLILLFSCSESYLFEDSKKLNNGIWLYSNPLEFEFEISDTSKSYNLFLSIDHSTDFTYQNLYSKIYTTFPDKTTVQDTISLELVGKFGNWLGDCSQSNCELDLLLQSSTRFMEPGNYKIALEQYNRMDSLSGVNSIGFMISQP